MENGKIIILVIGIVALLAGVSLLGYCIWTNYLVGKDTTAWLDRAQVASNPEDMGKYLDNAVKGMEKWNTTSGYNTVFFPTPENDMSLVYEALKQNRDRTEYMKQFSTNSTEYQVALDDLRGNIRELDLQMPGAYYAVHGIWWLMWVAMILIILAIFLIPMAFVD